MDTLRIRNSFTAIDIRLTEWMARYGLLLLRCSLGIVFFWFGFLKFFPGLSPAQDLATNTTAILTFGLIPAQVSLVILATWECLIGLGLITGKFMRATLLLLWLQMLGTITPIFFFPEEVFARVPYALTFEGQYIVKNCIIVSAAIVLGATVRGGKLMAEGEVGSQETERTAAT